MSLTFEDLLPPQHPGSALFRRGRYVDAITWDCLVREGHLVPLTDEIARLRSVPATSLIRSMAIARGRPAGAAICDASALWVHDPASGARLTGQIPLGTRVAHRRLIHRGPVRMLYTRATPRPRAPADAAIVLRRTSVADGDVDLFQVPGGPPIPVTSLTRTALDLASRHPAREIVPALQALAALGVDLEAVEHRLHVTPRWIGRERALRTLGSLLDGNSRLDRSAALSA